MDELQELITQLKTDEREKANYMTYQMKIAEERSEAKAEGLAEGLAQVAIGMLKENEPMEKIIRYTNLSRERIDELALQLAKNSPVPSL